MCACCFEHVLYQKVFKVWYIVHYLELSVLATCTLSAADLGDWNSREKLLSNGLELNNDQFVSLKQNLTLLGTTKQTKRRSRSASVDYSFDYLFYKLQNNFPVKI